MEKKNYSYKKMLFLLLSVTLILSTCSVSSNAAASKKALKFLKGKWYSNSQSGYGSTFYVKFTKKYAKYYYADEHGKYHYGGKSKIVSTKKYEKGYWIKLKSSNGGKFSYVSFAKDTLDNFSTWKRKEFPYKYSGSSSLSRFQP